MKKLLLLAALVMAPLCLHNIVFNEASSAQEQPRAESYVPGEVLLKLKDTSAQQSVASMHDSLGADVKTDFSEVGWQHIKLPDGLDIFDALHLYRSDPNVASVQPNYVYGLFA